MIKLIQNTFHNIADSSELTSIICILNQHTLLFHYTTSFSGGLRHFIFQVENSWKGRDRGSRRIFRLCKRRALTPPGRKFCRNFPQYSPIEFLLIYEMVFGNIRPIIVQIMQLWFIGHQEGEIFPKYVFFLMKKLFFSDPTFWPLRYLK